MIKSQATARDAAKQDLEAARQLVRLGRGHHYDINDPTFAEALVNGERTSAALYTDIPVGVRSRPLDAFDGMTVSYGDGQTWTPELLHKQQSCGRPSTWAPCFRGAKPAAAPRGAWDTIKPFYAIYSETCAAMDIAMLDELRTEVFDGLARGLPSAVSSMLYTGAVTSGDPAGQIPGAVNSDYVTKDVPALIDITPSSGPLSVDDGIARLSGKLACCNPGRSNTILVPSILFDGIDGDKIQQVGRSWQTRTGARLMVDCAFDGRLPGAATAPASSASELAIYGVGPVSVLLGRPFSPHDGGEQGTSHAGAFPAAVLNRDPITGQMDNTMTVMAEQLAAVGFEKCCRFLVRVKAC
jgi:hypothetical protein